MAREEENSDRESGIKTQDISVGNGFASWMAREGETPVTESGITTQVASDGERASQMQEAH